MLLQGVILLLCGIGGIVFSRFLESAIGIIICIALMVVFIILMIIDIMQTARRNALPSEVIIYKDGAFFLTDEYGETTKFFLDDILDMDYKLYLFCRSISYRHDDLELRKITYLAYNTQ